MAQSLIGSITAVFDAMLAWFADSLGTAGEIFYNTTNNSLTFIGVVTIIGLGIAVATMVVAVIRSLLRLR